MSDDLPVGLALAPRPAVVIDPPERYAAPSREFLSRAERRKALAEGRSTLGKIRPPYKATAAWQNGRQSDYKAGSGRLAHARTDKLPDGYYNGDIYGMKGYDMRKSAGTTFWTPCPQARDPKADCSHPRHSQYGPSRPTPASADSSGGTLTTVAELDAAIADYEEHRRKREGREMEDVWLPGEAPTGMPGWCLPPFSGPLST